MRKLFYLIGLIVLHLQCEAQAGNYIQIPAGDYHLGDTASLDNPKRTVHIESFWISKFELTNAEFEKFVQATGYKTLAERYHNAMVFEPGLAEFRWLQDSTAYWRFPNGVIRGGIAAKMDHPVTCISYKDVLAYCTWANCRLPSFDEWEVAARAGSEDYYFEGFSKENMGDYANVWHGRDHLKADYSDGYLYTSPVGKFKPNPWGLYDIFGNVFEFCTGKLERDGDRSIAHARGGSWWCSKNSCAAFNTVYIGSVSPNASFSNLGFRIVKKAFTPENKDF
ncbi:MULTISPECIES: SUMF1/EgtB/PvdO family nonheme iron enzyme [Sphingobacterium]|uniref:SUMF1/EgtB/PvdO family nonheme iron enzyme n=1 Tax=Sphingobacterium TaxID=28453 RepID=UPI0009F60DC9|nr:MULTISPECIES: SUMF1/EgtB/PvdO family nonheme iron enzyme [Sphingobacterium]QQT63725.1 SUMF1/EgtB/PvdO family nonheme iron enzyme [Sphingobacterium multivorum]HAK30353.1 sulfatase-modifying factor protein [Sphingobacterium sp.]